MKPVFDHIDLRVPNLERATPFYERLLPALGFTRRVVVEGWLQFETTEPAIAQFFGITEHATHIPNHNRIAFRADSAAAVDSLSKVAIDIGATHIEGPMHYEPGYYAVFFEDPFGNRFEICYRTQNAPEDVM